MYNCFSGLATVKVMVWLGYLVVVFGVLFQTIHPSPKRSQTKYLNHFYTPHMMSINDSRNSYRVQ